MTTVPGPLPKQKMLEKNALCKIANISTIKNCHGILENIFSGNFCTFFILYRITIDISYRIGYHMNITYGIDKT